MGSIRICRICIRIPGFKVVQPVIGGAKDDAYRVGAVLLDLNDPFKILARTKDFIMEPEEEYETNGYYNGCVFPTAVVEKDGELYIYYGAGDKVCCLATVNKDELVKYLKEECHE